MIPQLGPFVERKVECLIAEEEGGDEGEEGCWRRGAWRVQDACWDENVERWREDIKVLLCAIESLAKTDS